MAYHYKKTLFHTPFNAFVEDLTVALYKEGFVILASSDIRRILKDSLHVNVKKYEIISVIIPHLFNEMLALQPFPGIVLPSQITVSETSAREVEVSIVDATRLMVMAIEDPGFRNITDEIDRRLNIVVEQLSHKPVGVPDGLV